MEELQTSRVPRTVRKHGHLAATSNNRCLISKHGIQTFSVKICPYTSVYEGKPKTPTRAIFMERPRIRILHEEDHIDSGTKGREGRYIPNLRA